jgi:hypothetical protein
MVESDPSYFLRPFDVVPRVYPDRDDKAWELMYDDLQDGLNEGTVATYVLCSEIDNLDEKFKHTEEFDDTETLDDALEHFRGNSTTPEGCK